MVAESGRLNRAAGFQEKFFSRRRQLVTRMDVSASSRSPRCFVASVRCVFFWKGLLFFSSGHLSPWISWADRLFHLSRNDGGLSSAHNHIFLLIHFFSFSGLGFCSWKMKKKRHQALVAEPSRSQMWFDPNQRRLVLPRDPSEMCGGCVRMWVWCVCVHAQTYRRRADEPSYIRVAHSWDLCTSATGPEVRRRGTPWNELKGNYGNKLVMETTKLGKTSNMGERFWCSYEVVFQTCPYRSVLQKCHGDTFPAFIGTCADGVTWPVHFQ